MIVYERREAKTVVDRHGENITLKPIANFWTFMETTDGYVIKVVIRQFGERGQKHFLAWWATGKRQEKTEVQKLKIPHHGRIFSVSAISDSADRDWRPADTYIVYVLENICQAKKW